MTCLCGSSPFSFHPMPDPVNENFLNRGSSTSFCARSDEMGRTDSIPLGRSVRSNSSARASAPSGVAPAGLMTMGAPTARAGATLCATRFTGKLNGVIPMTGPRAKRLTIPARDPSASSVSSARNSPSNLRASSAAHRKVETALATCMARSSTRSAMPREIAMRASARAWVGRCRDSLNAPAAFDTASSTSWSVGTPISSTTEPSKGLLTSSVPSPVRHSPAT